VGVGKERVEEGVSAKDRERVCRGDGERGGGEGGMEQGGKVGGF